MKIIVIHVFLLLTTNSFCQDVVIINRDSTQRSKKSNFGKTIENLFHRDVPGKSEGHWAGIDFGFSFLLNDSYNRYFSDSLLFLKNIPSKSIVFNLNPVEYKLNFGTPHIGLTTGLGFSFKILSIPDNYRLVHPIGNKKLTAFVDSINLYKKNNLFNAYITLPLMLEINSHKDEYESFYFAFGVIGSAKIGTHYKRKGVRICDNKKFKHKEEYEFIVNSFLIDGVLRVGYKNVGLFCQLGLSPFFERRKMLDFRRLSFGLSLNL